MGRRRSPIAWACALLFLGALAAALLPSPRPPVPPARHEDPGTAPSESDPGSLLRYYAAGLSELGAWRIDEAKRLLLHLDPASLPPELRSSASDLSHLLLDGGDQLAAMDRLLREAALQARTGRAESARRLLQQLRRHVERGTVLLGYTVQDLQAFVRGTPGTGGGAITDPASREAYQELLRLAARARALMAAYAAAARSPGSAAALTTVLPYPTDIALRVPRAVYPGRPFVVSGTVRELAPTPSRGRHLTLLLDGRTVAELPVRSFRRTLVLPPDTPSGSYRLQAEVPARGRYLAASTAERLDVQQARLLITMAPPPLAFAPGRATLSGSVRSRFGPVAGATVRAWTAEIAGTALTDRDGTFRIALRVPGGLETLGPQDLRIRVLPREPWNAPGETSARLLVLNLPGVGLGALAACAAVLWAVRGRGVDLLRLSRPHPRPRTEGAGEGRPHPERLPLHGPWPWPERGEIDPSTPLGKLIRIYGDALSRVQTATGLSLPPSTTLREFAAQAGAAPGGPTFARMTALAERAVYAGRAVGRDLVAQMEELGRILAREVQGAPS